MNCVGAVWWVFCASAYEMLCFSITLIIGHLPPFDMYCVLIIPALRAFEPAISVPQNQPRRDSQRDFAYAGSGNHSAIHVKIRPGYVRGLWTGDKRPQRGDLINVPIAVECCEGLLRYRPLARGGIRIRIDRTRLDIVSCDAPVPHLSGQPLSEHLDRSLCGRIGHEAGRQGTLTYGRTDHDDAATARHVLQRRLRRDVYTANIDVNQAVHRFLRARPGANDLFSEGGSVARPIPVSAPSGSSHVSVVDSPRPRSWTDNILRTTLVRVLVRLPNEGGCEHYH